jgi:hypothetical protein
LTGVCRSLAAGPLGRRKAEKLGINVVIEHGTDHHDSTADPFPDA